MSAQKYACPRCGSERIKVEAFQVGWLMANEEDAEVFDHSGGFEYNPRGADAACMACGFGTWDDASDTYLIDWKQGAGPTVNHMKHFTDELWSCKHELERILHSIMVQNGRLSNSRWCAQAIVGRQAIRFNEIFKRLA